MKRSARWPVTLVTALAGLLLWCACSRPDSAPEEAAEWDLILQGGAVLTMDPQGTIYDPGFVAVKDNQIAALGPEGEIGGRKAGERLDTAGRLVIPGLINGHQHAPMTLMRGLADDLELMEWLRGYIFPAEARHVDEDFVYWGTMLAGLEMIASGTTTFADMYYFEDKVAEAAERLGLRAVLGQTIIDFPAPDHADPQAALAYTEAFIRRWKGHALITPAVAPHAPYTCSQQTLLACRDLAAQHDVPLLIHLSETEAELEQIRQKYGLTPIGWLNAIGFLQPRLIAAHVVWAGEEDLQILKRHRVGVVHNPESNMKLASGTAPVARLLELGIPLGLGTDGAASNNNLDLLQEMDSAAKIHKLHNRRPDVLPASQVLALATRSGAEALGLAHLVGSLEPGKRADLVVLDPSQPSGIPSFNPYSTIVYSLNGHSVETVIIEGRTVYRERRFVAVEAAEIYAQARRYGERLKADISR